MKKLPQELLSKSPSKRFVLIGMPGSGKTTLGRAFAEDNGLDFYDTDELVEKNVKMPVGEYILLNEETAYRYQELRVCQQLEGKTNCVISAGGGTVLLEESAKTLTRDSFVILIERPIEKLDFSNRPLSPNPEIGRVLYEERKDLYDKYSDYVFKNDDEE